MKKIVNLVFIILIALMMCACGYSKEEKKYMKDLEKQASKNAVSYIQKKYGFTPSITSTTVEKVDTTGAVDFTPDPTGFIYVDLSYNGKSFQVYINGREETEEGFDNYQFEEIVNDLIEFVTRKTGLQPYNYQVYYGSFYNVRLDYTNTKGTHNGLIKELYNGNNLYSINNINIKMDYINQRNLEFIKDEKIFENSDLDFKNIALYNYYSIDAYNISSHNIEDALNIESAYVNSAGLENYYKFNLKNIEDVYYYSEPMNAIGEISLVETTIVDASSWIGKGAFKNVEQISKAYKVVGLDTDNNTINKMGFYIPIDSIDKYKTNDISIGIECGGYLNASSIGVNRVGNYIYGTVYFNSCLAEGKNDIRFTLLYSTY